MRLLAYALMPNGSFSLPASERRPRLAPVPSEGLNASFQTIGADQIDA
jgi:hypothetical protein